MNPHVHRSVDPPPLPQPGPTLQSVPAASVQGQADRDRDREARLELACYRRDPGMIRALMPLWAWAHRHYFRVSSRGWQHVPSQGPVLFVGSHNGALAAPDMHMAIYEWYRREGLDRPIRGLAHPKLWRVYPPLAHLAVGIGAIPAHARLARAAIAEGSSLLVYPGGAQEACRPLRDRGRIALQGRTGFLRLALDYNLPVIPVVSWGSHDTVLILEDFYPLARSLHRKGLFPWPLGIDPEVFPLYLGLPWGVMLGPIPNLPLPAPIRLDIGQPIRFAHHGRDAGRDRAYVRDCYLEVESRMQAQLDQLRQAPASRW